MKVVTARQMREMDRRSIEEYGIPGILLMENAGRGVADVVRERYPRTGDDQVLVVCGKGNNGGDGFVTARHLHRMGMPVRTVLLGEAGQLKGDAAINCGIAQKMGLAVDQLADSAALPRLTGLLDGCSLVIDAILGTGLTAGVSGFFSEAIKLINGSGKPVVAMDIPSGLNSDWGEIPGEHIRALLTVTLALPKVGQLLYPAAESVGELVVVDIGISKEVMEDPRVAVNLLSDRLLSPLIPYRRPDSHKGTYGHLVVAAGSTGKIGAGILAAKAALRAGAGLVTLAVPESCAPIAETAMVESMTLPLPETDRGAISVQAAPVITEFMKDKDALVIGPGITTDPSTRDFFLEILANSSVPIVVDADGCNNLRGNLDLLKNSVSPLLLTPHPGEMAWITDRTVKKVQADRLEIARDFAVSYDVYLALKGVRTLVCDPAGHVFINPTGNPAMATAGMGDVLSGMAGSFLAQGLSPLDALNLGVFLHGRCGDMAAERKGRTGILAGDLPDLIPEALEDLRKDDRDSKLWSITLPSG